MDMDAPATQVEFGELVGITKQAVFNHIQSGVLPANGTLRQWLSAYCSRLRNEAAGRIPSNARERRDLAIARQAEAKAALDEREMHRLDGLILDLESVRHAMMAWAALGKNEFISAVDNIVTAIESEHGISLDRDELQPHIEAALRVIGDYEYQPGHPSQGSSQNMDSAA